MTTAPTSIVRNGVRLGRVKAPASEAAAPPSEGVLVEQFRGKGQGAGRETGVQVWRGDCRTVIPARVPKGSVDLVFADPPFNWRRAYDTWDDDLPPDEYLREFTYVWLDRCIEALSERGSLWVNIPDDWAAEIVVHLKSRGLLMVNWCVWHYRFGQNTTDRFINSKVHALYFARPTAERVWNPREVLEMSDRKAIYGDARTESKRDGMPPGMRVPMDVWYGQYWGRVQGNNKERRGYHDNQLPEVYLERVIRACSNPGDTVMDPFLGSGTTGVMAHALGREFIGVEFSAANAASAIARIKDGPLRLNAAKGASTAIFGKRAAGPKRGKRGPYKSRRMPTPATLAGIDIKKPRAKRAPKA